MMRTCWELEPDTFKELHTITSKYIEQIAGYLDLGFNPFTEKNITTEEKKENDVGDAIQSDSAVGSHLSL